MKQLKFKEETPEVKQARRELKADGYICTGFDINLKTGYRREFWTREPKPGEMGRTY